MLCTICDDPNSSIVANQDAADGCADALYDSIYRHLDIAIAVCVIVGAIQLLGMVLSMILCCCISTQDKKYDY
ncbi:hypothetical protein ANCCAN_00299 [Ancylostoma caninum]|uniref:Uncharacterized protein n=1 Tax=Ancylostoma caninum TaxID=29170 RepID=A0A368HF14_ANCCA|nr:hypothetical protein ANCCAN_00299 [Ancylostoma caninum]